jgi:pimeloyl-ACP methyl ester carboxylesterase
MPTTELPHLSKLTPDGRVAVAPKVKLAYVDRGSGQAIVFVPGWTFSKEIFEKQIAVLSQKYRVIAYDPRSQGDSSYSVEGNDYLTHADDLAVLLEALGVEKPILVGWSAGAHTCLGFIKHHGVEAISAFICVDMPPRSLSFEKDAWSEGSLDEISAVHTLYLRDARGHADFIKMYAENMLIQRSVTAEELNWIISLSLKCPTLVAAQLFASSMFSDNTAPAMAIVRAKPTLFFIAQHWAEKALPYLKTVLPETKAVVFGGRMMFWEHPDAFNRVVDEFIANNVPAPTKQNA